MRGKRKTGWKPFILTVVALILIGAGYAIFSVVRMVSVTIPHSYAAWETGNLLVEYMETHSNSWPRSWDQLRDATNRARDKGRSVYCTFEKLPGIVKIDWNFEPETLVNSDTNWEQRFRKVVTQLDGSTLDSAWGPDTEPNAKVRNYLLSNYRIQTNQNR
jgi:hypothetical protein